MAGTAGAARAAPARAHLAGALLLMAASGFAALGLQIVWTQQSAAWLGHEAAAILGVVTAFFGGLALGALVLGPSIQRSSRPLRWYAVCEAAIALWTLSLLLLLTPASHALLMLTGAEPAAAWQWGVAFIGSFLLLLPATAAMGATLPALERVLAQRARTHDSVAALYAANTLGAVAGVLAAAFWLVPGWGLASTAMACAALNLACAGLAGWALRGGAPGQPASEAAPAPSRVPASVCAAPAAASAGPLVWRLAATGFLGIGYEVLVVRALSQVAENTVYTFALLLAVYLAGTAIGAATLHAALKGRAPSVRLRDGLLIALALSCLAGSASLWALLSAHETLRDTLDRALNDAGSHGMAAALGAEAGLALMAFGLPTLVMGALFSVLVRQSAATPLGLGRAIGINTLGAALAPPLVGVVLLTAAGAKAALLLVALGYLALLSRAALRGPPTWGLLGAGVALALWAPPLVTVDVPEGGELVHFEEGARAAVSVVKDDAGVLRLHIDNRQPEGSSATARADGRQALLPLLLHPAPRRALFLGLGTGVTAATAAEDPALAVEVVELLPEVVRAAALFTPALADGTRHPRLQVQVADARRFVRHAGRPYDLIVSDNFHPARSGSAALYTVEHFAAVKARLAPQGLFCQWLPLHQMDLQTLRSIVRSYTAVYPQAFVVLATHSLDTPVLGLVSRADGGVPSLADVHRRLAPRAPSDTGTNGNVAARLAQQSGLADEWAVLGSVVAGPAALQRWAAGAPLNTDDHPVVAYLAPRITYAPQSRPRDRLLQWLDTIGAAADDAVDAGSEPAAQQRLATYRAARLRYLQAGRNVQPSADPRRMLQQVQAPLLEVLRISPDFRPVYEPLVALAQALAPSDPAAAAALLQQLLHLQPGEPSAMQALQAIRPHGGAVNTARTQP